MTLNIGGGRVQGGARTQWSSRPIPDKAFQDACDTGYPNAIGDAIDDVEKIADFIFCG
jgi:hypothetical protein